MGAKMRIHRATGFREVSQWLLTCLFVVYCVVSNSATNSTLDSANQESSDRWGVLRAQLFGERKIQSGTGIISFDAPARAFDSARVTITIKALSPQSESSYIEKLYLIVDNNPVPVAATFLFESGNDWDTVDTELRINEYTDMRVVAQLNDGSLHMDNSFIKAVGGCSAPPSSYDRSDAANMGTFGGGVNQLINPKVRAVARIRVTHPNASGMQFDQFTRTYIPAHFIHTMGASYNGKKLFTVDTNFSMSQDPVLGFNFKPSSDGELKIYAVDSKDNRYEKSWMLKADD